MSEEAKAEALEDEETTQETAEASESAEPEQGPLFTPARLRLIRRAVPVLWLLAVVVVGRLNGIEPAFLVLAAGVLTLVITLMWSSVQSLTGGSALGFEEALGMGAPSKVEEEKRAVLRALKDLEYERGVGKISPEDYAELSARYRSEAKRLIQSLDEALAPARREVEQALEQRLQRAGVTPPAVTDAPADTAPPEPAAAAAAKDES